MPKDRYRVQLATYNGNLGKGASLLNPTLSEWLIPTLNQQDEEYYGSNEKERSSFEPTDIIAIGFQEMIPLVRHWDPVRRELHY
jgi:hypothetical protein